jgi:putative photosynthetic complex assembly protein
VIHIEQEAGSDIRVPRGALLAMGGLVVATMVLAGVARATGTGAVGNPVLTVGDGPALTIAFEGDAEGTVHVIDVATGRTLETLAPGEGGFLRGVLRPLERERVRRGLGADAPYELRYNADASLLLSDPLTDVAVDVAAFGATSSGAFARLLEAASRPVASAPDPTVPAP